LINLIVVKCNLFLITKCVVGGWCKLGVNTATISGELCGLCYGVYIKLMFYMSLVFTMSRSMCHYLLQFVMKYNSGAMLMLF